MCVNKKNGCSGCNVGNGCGQLKFAKVQNSKLLSQSFESVYINIGTSQYNATVISDMDKNTANFALQRAVK